MIKQKQDHREGFSLLEILLAMTILGVITIFAVGLATSIRGGASITKTRSMMTEIVAQAKATYRNTGELPPSTTGTEVPVGPTALNLEQKYRYDAWGTLLQYHRHTKTGTFLDATGTTTATITDVFNSAKTINGNECAGFIVSAGPDQVFAQTYAANASWSTTSDDILTPIDVTAEAKEIAFQELQELLAKVKAVDALYEGIDNDGDGDVDESGCVEVETSVNGCPPISWPSATSTVDPNCGTDTLDNYAVIGGVYGCGYTNNGPLHLVFNFYSLSVAACTDPWGSPYQWGQGEGGGGISLGSSDPRYHKFFSLGPDGLTGAPLTTPSLDDIIP